MNVELAFRFLGAAIFAVGGWSLGSSLRLPVDRGGIFPGGLVGIAIGILVGFFLTPYLSTRPASFTVERVRRLPFRELLAAVLGLLVGLVLAALLAIPLSMLPDIFGRILPFAGCLFLSYLGITIMVARKDDFFGVVGWHHLVTDGDSATRRGGALLDTSAIIDGRIADVGQTGFVPGPMIVPRFVLGELQRIADSADAVRRNRGRRGLEILDKMKKNRTFTVRIEDVEADGDGVDDKLLALAQRDHYAIVTSDFNLNRVARLQGISVLNVNALANAVKTVVLPGEEMVVRVIEKGREPTQGVGYLDDGTMVVIEGGWRYVDSELEIVVTRVLQKEAGRMIFAQAKAALPSR